MPAFLWLAIGAFAAWVLTKPKQDDDHAHALGQTGSFRSSGSGGGQSSAANSSVGQSVTQNEPKTTTDTAPKTDAEPSPSTTKD